MYLLRTKNWKKRSLERGVDKRKGAVLSSNIEAEKKIKKIFLFLFQKELKENS